MVKVPKVTLPRSKTLIPFGIKIPAGVKKHFHADIIYTEIFIWLKGIV